MIQREDDNTEEDDPEEELCEFDADSEGSEHTQISSGSFFCYDFVLLLILF